MIKKQIKKVLQSSYFCAGNNDFTQKIIAVVCFKIKKMIKNFRF